MRNSVMAVVLAGFAAVVCATTPARGQCTDGDNDGFYREAGCGTPEDCDDTNSFVSPGAVQTCDGTNNDCGDPLWPSIPQSEIDGDGDDFATCVGSCELRVTTDTAINSLASGDSWSPSIVALDDGFAVSYSFDSAFRVGYRAIRLDRWGRRIAGPVETEQIESSSPAISSLAKGSVGFGLAWVYRPTIYFSLLSEDFAQIGTDTPLTDPEICDSPYSPRILWNGFEFAIVWLDYCFSDESGYSYGAFFARVSADGMLVGGPTKIVDAMLESELGFVWNGVGYALVWLHEDSATGEATLYFQEFAIDGSPHGAQIPVGPSHYWGHSLVWTGGGYAVASTDDRSGDLEIYLTRLDASGQRLGEDTRVTNATGDSIHPALVWSGEDYRLAWEDHRDGLPQVYFARLAANGDVIEPGRSISLTPPVAGGPAAVWGGSTTMIIYPARVPPRPNFDRIWDLFDARESCHDCEDLEGSVYPGAAQICDGLNNDCESASWPSLDYTNEVDLDGDGISACAGDCDESSAAIHPGAIEICNGIDDNCDTQSDEDAQGLDSDSDGVHNACDNCRFACNPDQLDSDGDTFGDACDNCALLANPDQADTDSDQRGNACDNCPALYNPYQDDFDTDRAGDACDNCTFDFNPSQSDFDDDNQGDLCDVDDGLIYVYSTDRNYREWQAESGYATWNSYRGSLAVLRSTGEYTQAPGSNPDAARDCGLTDPWVFDDLVPATDDPAYFLTTGIAGGVESGLGTDSSGAERPNANPCP